MKPIDADTLKTHLWNHVDFSKCDYCWSEVCSAIDDAPAIETDKELNEKIETYKNAYRIMSDAFENEVRKNQRLQGKWIKVKDQLPEVPEGKQLVDVLVVAKVYFVPDHVDQRNWTYVVEKATYEPKYGFYGNNIRDYNVKEWMYAPEMPKRYARYVWREEDE